MWQFGGLSTHEPLDEMNPELVAYVFIIFTKIFIIIYNKLYVISRAEMIIRTSRLLGYQSTSQRQYYKTG